MSDVILLSRISGLSLDSLFRIFSLSFPFFSFFFLFISIVLGSCYFVADSTNNS